MFLFGGLRPLKYSKCYLNVTSPLPPPTSEHFILMSDKIKCIWICSNTDGNIMRPSSSSSSSSTLVTQYCLQFCVDGLQIFRYVTLAQVSRSQGVVIFHNSLCLSNISCSFVLMDFKLRHLVSIDKMLNWFTFCDLASIVKVMFFFKCVKDINFAL